MEPRENIFFIGEYNILHDAFFPIEPIEHIKDIKIQKDTIILHAPCENKKAITEFMRIFPMSSLSQQKAFMKNGYIHLKLSLLTRKVNEDL